MSAALDLLKAAAKKAKRHAQDCIPANCIESRWPGMLSKQELAFGNFDSPTPPDFRQRIGWITQHLLRVPEPIPFTSKQGLVSIPEEIHQELKRQWRERDAALEVANA